MFANKHNLNTTRAEKEYQEFIKITEFKNKFEKGDFTNLQEFLEIKIHGMETLNYILEWAIHHNRSDLIDKLIYYGANVQKGFNIFLRTACMKGNLEIINYLWKINNNISETDCIILVNIIIESEKIETIKFMVDNKIYNFHLKLDYLLNEAIVLDKYNLIKDLFDLGAKIYEEGIELIKPDYKMYDFIRNIIIEKLKSGKYVEERILDAIEYVDTQIQ